MNDNEKKKNTEKLLKFKIEALKLNIEAKQILLKNLLEDEDEAEDLIE